MPYRMSGELASKIDCGIATKNLGRRGPRKALAEHSNSSSAPKNAPKFHFREILADQN